MIAEDEVRELLDTLTPPRVRSTGDWEAVMRDAGSRRRGRRAAAAACLLVAAILVATPALGLGDEAVRLFAGRQAPAPIQEAVAPLSGAGPAKAYVRIRTSVGAYATFVSTRSRRDEPCIGIVWEGTGRRSDAVLACGTEDEPQPLWAHESGRRVRGSWVALVFGATAPDVDRVELVSTTGAAIPVPLSASRFLVEVPRWAGDAHLVAYGYGGIELGRRKLETPPSWTPPEPIGDATPVLVREFANRRWEIFNYEATDSRRCYGITTEPANDGATGSNSSSAFRCIAERDASPLSVLGPDIWPDIAGSGSWTSVVGVVGEEVQRVNVTEVNGGVREAPIRNGTFFYISRATDRPVRVEAFNSSGELLGAEPLR